MSSRHETWRSLGPSPLWPKTWLEKVGLGLLLLALVGLTAPAATALGSGDSCCPEMQRAGEGGESPARCQWITPASCCQQSAAMGAAPAFPAAAALASRIAALWPRDEARKALPAVAPPTSQRLALATVVLRL